MKFLFILSLFAFADLDKGFLSYIDIRFVQRATTMNDVFITGGDIKGSIVSSYNINEKNIFYLSYILNYTGPGVYSLERDLNERELTNTFIIEEHLNYSQKIRIRPQIYTSYQRFKDNAFDSYSDNIYNNNSTGFGLSIDYLAKYTLSSFYINYRTIRYQNYTDLLSEISYDSTLTKTGMYDKKISEIGIRFKKGNIFSEINYNHIAYDKQKVIESSGVYGNKKQLDKQISLKTGFEYTTGIFELYPSIEFLFYLSNQNYLRFKSSMDTSPSFIRDAYSHYNFKFSLPIEKSYNKFNIRGGLDIMRRVYRSRPPRDVYNNYISNKNQYQNILSLYIDLTKNITDFTYMDLGYTLTISSSNNEFEFYVPYNYTSHLLFLGFGVKI